MFQTNFTQISECIFPSIIIAFFFIFQLFVDTYASQNLVSFIQYDVQKTTGFSVVERWLSLAPWWIFLITWNSLKKNLVFWANANFCKKDCSIMNTTIWKLISTANIYALFPTTIHTTHISILNSNEQGIAYNDHYFPN